ARARRRAPGRAPGRTSARPPPTPRSSAARAKARASQLRQRRKSTPPRGGRAKRSPSPGHRGREAPTDGRARSSARALAKRAPSNSGSGAADGAHLLRDQLAFGGDLARGARAAGGERAADVVGPGGRAGRRAPPERDRRVEDGRAAAGARDLQRAGAG